MFLHKKAQFVALCGAAILGVAACGGESTAAASGDSPTSPLAEFLGEPDYFSADPAASQASFEADERERQLVIAECMKEQGFDYTPVDPGQYAVFEDADGLEFGSEEWTATYGFGITTQRFGQAQVGPDLLGWDDSFLEDQFDGDPNQAIVEAMSPSDQEAYYEALYGDEEAFPQFDESLSDEEAEAQMEDFEFKPQGCEGEAWDQDPASRFYTDFSDELDEMYERMEADPRITAAEQEIADCVAEQGLTYPGMEDLYEQWEDDLSAMEANLTYPGEDLTEEDYAQLSEEELDEIFSEQPQLLAEDRERLGELQAEEITLALAVDECGGGFDDQQDLYAEVVAEYEQEFLDTNADRLADYQAE